MPLPLEKVNPGDLITADFMNRLIDRLDALEGRVDLLEGGSGGEDDVLITALVPPGPLREGQELQILGRNFGFSTGAHRVFFDSERVDEYELGSSDTSLVVNVPELDLEAARDVTLTVSNGISVDTRTIRISPREQAPQGNIDVDWEDVDPNPIERGQPATIAYELTWRGSPAATFRITPTVSVSSWQSGLQVLDQDEQPLASREIRLNPDESVPFFIRIPNVTSDAPDSFTLTVEAHSGDIVGSDNDRTFNVGSDTELPDETITINPSGFVPASAFDGSTIRLAQGVLGTMTLNAEFTQQGTYDVSVELEDASNWTAVLHETPPEYVLEAGDFTGGTASETPRFRIRPNAGASATGAVVFQLRREGATRERSVRFNLALQT